MRRHAQKKAAKCQKPQPSPQHTARKHKYTVLSPARIQRKQKIPRKAQQDKQRIRNMREAPYISAQSAQNVIAQRKQAAEQKRAQKLPALQSQRQLHQRSRRLKKPPPLRTSS